MSNATPPPAAWYPDPSGTASERWWNGRAWTASTQEAAHRSDVRSAPTSYAPIQPYVPAGPVMPLYSPVGASVAAPVGVWRSHVDDRPVVFGMGDALKVLFAKYATFDGRASRSEFWYFALFNALLAAGVLVVFMIGLLVPPLLVGGGVAYFALIVWLIVVIVPQLALEIRRLRDAGFHWGYIFLAFVPFGSIVLLVMCCLPSKHP